MSSISPNKSGRPPWLLAIDVDGTLSFRFASEISDSYFCEKVGRVHSCNSENLNLNFLTEAIMPFSLVYFKMYLWACI